MFNEWGNIPVMPDEIRKAQQVYFDTLKPYLDKMSIVQVRAFQQYTDFSSEFATYILTRQMTARKTGNLIP